MSLKDSFNYSDSVIKGVNIDVNTIFLEAKTKKPLVNSRKHSMYSSYRMAEDIKINKLILILYEFQS